jgi:hypothetical protein
MRARMTRLTLIVAYLASAATAVIVVNANSGDGSLAIVIWATASVLLGLGTGQLSLALLALLAIPFAIPFGIPNHYQYSEPLPIWWYMAFCAFASAALIFLTALTRRFIETHRQQRAS